MRSTLLPRTCEHCQRRFFARADKVKKGLGRYCSRACSGAAHAAAKNGNWKGGISTNNYHYKKLYVERHPDAVSAHRRMNCVRRRKGFTPKSCEKCGTTKQVCGHHEDYSRPEDVQWLCRSCHRQLHGARC